MKTKAMSFAAACEYQPPNPERTARRNIGWDVEFKEWPNRAALAKSIRMQQKREPRQNDWFAVVPLGDGEGY
jgi:hypothetical protein